MQIRLCGFESGCEAPYLWQHLSIENLSKLQLFAFGKRHPRAACHLLDSVVDRSVVQLR